MFRIFALSFLLLTSPLSAQQTPSEQQQLVDKASIAFSALISNENYRANIQHLIENAYGVILIPDYIKAGFLIGGEGGSGVVLTRKSDGSWSYPSFIMAAGGSFGLQAGVENSEIMLIVMTEKGMQSLANDSFTLGADVSVAAGTVGGGLSAQTTANLSADIFAFSHSKGLFGGGALKGTVIKEKGEWNQAYYHNAAARPEAILNRGMFQNQGAENLRFLLTNAKNVTASPVYTPPHHHHKTPSAPSIPERDLSAEAAPPTYHAPAQPAAPPYQEASEGPQELLPWARG